MTRHTEDDGSAEHRRKLQLRDQRAWAKMHKNDDGPVGDFARAVLRRHGLGPMRMWEVG